jgi:hypothetical protein
MVLTLAVMIMSGQGVFLTGLISLLSTRRFLRKAVAAKGSVSDIYEFIPTEARDYLFPCCIMTVQFWTEREESIEFQSHTFQGDPETDARSIPVLYDPNHPSQAKINSFEGLWFTSGLVMVIGAGFSLVFTSLFMLVLKQ